MTKLAGYTLPFNSSGAPVAKGRATILNTANRFEPLHLELDPVEPDDPATKQSPANTQYFIDNSRSVLSANNSPDIDFRFSINPYRGCEHGCIYCFARPTHEYLGFSAGLDFETKIIIKSELPELLADTLRKKSWKPQPIALSGNTDCYQPIERKFQITRRCLETFLEFRNPVTIITKNHLVVRDLDLLKELAALNLVNVTLSITSLQRDLINFMEPRTSRPEQRLSTIEKLATNNIPVGVNISPLIPGLNDHETPEIMNEVTKRGGKWAEFKMLRLPGMVAPLFLDWLHRTLPDQAEKILHQIQKVRRGRINDPHFGSRMTGDGELAKVTSTLFLIARRKHGIANNEPQLTTHHFRATPTNQLDLF